MWSVGREKRFQSDSVRQRLMSAHAQLYLEKTIRLHARQNEEQSLSVRVGSCRGRS